jgi:HEAT repeat protein
MNTLFCLSTLFIFASGQDYGDRERHPLAPSLPRLTKDEEKKIDAIIERFIQYDIGKLNGAEGKKALEDFNRLGPEAIFSLIDGLNRAANMESSCPAVIIAKKVGTILSRTEDMELLNFARESIGSEVTAKRHLNVLKDLQFSIILRRGALQREALARGGAKAPGTMSLADLEKAVGKESGAKLKMALTETEKRQGAKAVDILLQGTRSPDAEIAKLSQGLLDKNLKHQSADVLKAMLKHDRSDVRIAAAKTIGDKKLRYGAELIALLQDGDDDVRQAARRALRQISGLDHGPEANASFGDRETAIARWREWWSKQK